MIRVFRKLCESLRYNTAISIISALLSFGFGRNIVPAFCTKSRVDFQKGGNMYSTYKNLCDSKGVSTYAVCKATGIRASTISAWKNGEYTPKVDKLMKIADYFGVSVEEFIKKG